MATPNQDAKDDILKILEKRREYYGAARVRSVLLEDRGVWKNSVTRIELLHKRERS